MNKKEKVCFPSENKQGGCPGVLTGDTSKSKMGLVVLQEWWGMNEVIINEAADISERGNFVTLVPDLYRGKIATDHETAGHYMSDLDWPGAVQDIAAAAKYLKQKGRYAPRMGAGGGGLSYMKGAGVLSSRLGVQISDFGLT